MSSISLVLTPSKWTLLVRFNNAGLWFMSLTHISLIMKVHALGSEIWSNRQVKSSLTLFTKFSSTKLTVICSWVMIRRLNVLMWFRQICEDFSKSSKLLSHLLSSLPQSTTTQSTRPSPKSSRSSFLKSVSFPQWWTPLSAAPRFRKLSYSM